MCNAGFEFDIVHLLLLSVQLFYSNAFIMASFSLRPLGQVAGFDNLSEIIVKHVCAKKKKAREALVEGKLKDRVWTGRLVYEPIS